MVIAGQDLLHPRQPQALDSLFPWLEYSSSGMWAYLPRAVPDEEVQLEAELVKASWEKALMILWGRRNFFLLFKVLT